MHTIGAMTFVRSPPQATLAPPGQTTSMTLAQLLLFRAPNSRRTADRAVGILGRRPRFDEFTSALDAARKLQLDGDQRLTFGFRRLWSEAQPRPGSGDECCVAHGLGAEAIAQP